MAESPAVPHDDGSAPLTPGMEGIMFDPSTVPPGVYRLPGAITVDDTTPQFTTSASIGNIAKALAAAQAAIKMPKKDADNPFFKSKYADLHTVWESVRLALSGLGVAVIQSPSFSTTEMKGKTIGIITISTTVIHAASGEWINNVLRGTTEQIGPQAVGSAISYFRRYSLQPLLMLTPDDGSDDDGEKAEGRSTKPDSEKPPAEEIEKHTAAIKKANTIDALKAVYLAIPEAYRATFAKLVNARKAALEKDEVKPVEPKEQAVDGQGGTA